MSCVLCGNNPSLCFSEQDLLDILLVRHSVDHYHCDCRPISIIVIAWRWRWSQDGGRSFWTEVLDVSRAESWTISPKRLLWLDSRRNDDHKKQKEKCCDTMFSQAMHNMQSNIKNRQYNNVKYILYCAHHYLFSHCRQQHRLCIEVVFSRKVKR